MEKIQQSSIRGTPDIIMCLNGKFIAIELKIDDEAPNALQRAKLDHIERAGGIALAITPSNCFQILAALRKY